MKKWLEEAVEANDKEEVFDCNDDKNEHRLGCPDPDESESAVRNVIGGGGSMVAKSATSFNDL